jgi:hypothetical protein
MDCRRAPEVDASGDAGNRLRVSQFLAPDCPKDAVFGAAFHLLTAPPELPRPSADRDRLRMPGPRGHVCPKGSRRCLDCAQRESSWLSFRNGRSKPVLRYGRLSSNAISEGVSERTTTELRGVRLRSNQPRNAAPPIMRGVPLVFERRFIHASMT